MADKTIFDLTEVTDAGANDVLWLGVSNVDKKVKKSNLLKNIDADTLDTYHASTSSSANKIPVADSSGKLVNGWLYAASAATADYLMLRDSNGDCAAAKFTATHFQCNQTAGVDEEYSNGNSGSSITINWNNGNYQKMTATANCTLSFTAPSSIAGGKFQLNIYQNGGPYTMTFPSGIKWLNGATPGALSNGYTIFIFFYGSSTYFGTWIGPFS